MATPLLLQRAARWVTPPRAAALLVVVLIAAIWGATLQRSQFEAQKATASATRANSNLAIAYEENAANVIGDIDQTLKLIESEFRLEGAAAGDAVAAWPIDRALIRGLSLIGEDGRIIVATGDVPIADMSRAEEFLFQRDQPSRELHIGHPQRTPVSGAWSIAMSRGLSKRDGTFAGVAVATVDPEYFVKFYGRADLGQYGLVSLVGRDGIALARHATPGSTFGDDMRASTLLKEVARKPSGAFQSVGRLDGVARFVSYRTLEKYPLIVMVGTSREETLATVAARARLYYILAALASGVIALVALAFVRSLARQGRAFEALAEAQASLRDNEARGRAITENMAGGIITTDFDGAIRSVNSAACQMYGYDASEMLARNICNLVHQSARARIFAVFEELRSRGSDFKEDAREVLCVRKDGLLFESEVLLSSVTVGGERIYIGIVHDISERKRMERALQSSEAHLRVTFDQALVGIVHASLDGRILRVNQTSCRQLGYSEEEMLALSFRDVTHPDDLPLSASRIEALLADPMRPFAYQVTKRLLRKDGTVMWALSAVCVIRHHDGSPDFLLSMVQDITELKRVEQMKNEFVSTVSHELRTPLTSIRGSLGLLAGGVAGALPPPARELVIIAENNCARLIRLVNDILDTEKIESGKMRFDLRMTALDPLIERAVQSMEGFARAHDVPLRTSAPGEPVHGNVDADRFIQVMTNLISNAVKFSPPGTPVEIALSRADEGSARIEVRDRGRGIPQEFQARIFQRFSQADASDSRQKGGTGLGLCIAKGIVERLGGTIGFRSVPGEGTTFFVDLPACSKTTATPQARGVAQEA